MEQTFETLTYRYGVSLKAASAFALSNQNDAVELFQIGSSVLTNTCDTLKTGLDALIHTLRERQILYGSNDGGLEVIRESLTSLDNVMSRMQAVIAHWPQEGVRHG